MRIFAFDTETELIGPGNLAPRMVCLSYETTYGNNPNEWERNRSGAVLRRYDDALTPLYEALIDPECIIVGQNVAYDVAVVMRQFPQLLKLWFDAYREDRVADTMIREQLTLLAEGRFKGWPKKDGSWQRPRFDLDGLARKHLGWELDKDTWRLRYAEFRNTPLEDWPDGAKHYALKDAEATLGVFIQQERYLESLGGSELISNQFFQTHAALGLHLIACRGIMTDPAKVLKFQQATEAEFEDLEAELIDVGLVKPGGVRDTKAAKALMEAVCEAEGIPVKKTDKGGVCLDADACEESGDHFLMSYAYYSVLKSAISKDIPMLLAGCKHPIQTSFGLAESGRTTSRSNKELNSAGTGNMQNLRRGARQRKGESKEDYEARKERSGDIRSCFVPRKGFVFAQADYEGLELHTLAEVCYHLFGFSCLGEMLNKGIDPHLKIAARILKISYEEALRRKEAKDPDVDNARQTGKVANFGFPGGLGPKKLVLFARKSYGVVITEDFARELKALWLAEFPEMGLFFDHVASLDSGIVIQIYSNRIRGGCRFTSACNTYFQGLGSDATKAALIELTRACYYDEDSVLYGSRIVAFIHDEFILEVPEDPEWADACAHELSRIMCEAANKFLPHCPVEAPPLLMRYWSKQAKALKNAEGLLIAWPAKGK